MSEGPAKRRWFQFSLRTLFVVVTLLTILIGLLLAIHRFRGGAF